VGQFLLPFLISGSPHLPQLITRASKIREYEVDVAFCITSDDYRTMRVRLQLLAPFRESKLLLPLPATISTISELKKHIRQSLSTVRDTAPSTKDILLEIDGFELLAGSLVRDVVEEKDVIT
jgi:hypothetical protein